MLTFMTAYQPIFLTIGSILGFLGVAFGAFGAHFLRARLAVELLQTFEIGVRYQFYHALVLIVVSLLTLHTSSTWLIVSGWFFVVGTIIFSGSLYALTFSGIKAWGAITPFGGVFLLIGWALLFFVSLTMARI